MEKMPQNQLPEAVSLIFMNQRYFYLPTFELTLYIITIRDLEGVEGPQKLYSMSFYL